MGGGLMGGTAACGGSAGGQAARGGSARGTAACGNRAKTVWAVYFSATGTTEKIVLHIARTLARELTPECPAELRFLDFTLPAARQAEAVFTPDDIVVFGTPVYAGRVPNVLLPYLTGIKGGGAAAIPVVLFGNRDYDDALIELRNLLEQDGFHTTAAGAFVGEHSFSRTLAAGRPDEVDMERAAYFARQAAEKLKALPDVQTPVHVKGCEPLRGYYQPRDRAGAPVDIRKVLPKVGGACNDCGLCAEVCPMGSIRREDVRSYAGICIKCGACIKKCPRHARYYDDPAYLYHQHELEEGLVRRAEPELFF